MTKKRVYLAGKVQGAKWEIAHYIENEFAYFVASDGGNHSEHEWGGCLYGLSEYDDANMSDFVFDSIEASKLLVAYLDTPNSFGSIAEIAWASAHKIPCYMLVISGQAMFDAYWFISNFPGVVGMWVNDVVEATIVVDNLVKLESPIEIKFYEAAMRHDHLLATCLSAQKQIETPEFTYRVDFMLEYGDVKVAIELDGHDYPKTVDQRTHDARKDRYMHSKGISVLRYTGTEVWNNPLACVREVGKLLDKYRPKDEEDEAWMSDDPMVQFFEQTTGAEA